MALDIDGVVVRGHQAIPGSAEAVRMLREAGVPYAFMTNGGGVTESAKAMEIAELIGDDTLDASKVLLSHTPMRKLAERFKGRRVLLIGGSKTVGVAESYGFDVAGGMAVTPGQIIAGTPGIFPRSLATVGQDASLPLVNVIADRIPFEAILVFFEPKDYASELQVLTDVLVGGVPLGIGLGLAVEGPLRQRAEVFTSNSDFLWQASYPVPRFGQGAFQLCMRALWQRHSGGAELEITEYGKPHRVQYEAVEELLAASLGAGEAAPKRLYMIGDNPAADVRGANGAGEAWRSILVCTGVYQGGVSSNDPTDPAWRVEADLRSAVERLLNTPDEMHLAA